MALSRSKQLHAEKVGTHSRGHLTRVVTVNAVSEPVGVPGGDAEGGDPAADGVNAVQEPPLTIWQGRGLLIFVAAAYGSLTVALKMVYSMPGPPSAGMLSCVRGFMAAACFLPMIIRSSRNAGSGQGTDSKGFWFAAGELAVWNLGAQGLCNVALMFTDATRVSFLTQASIAFTPVLASLTGDKVPLLTWVGCIFAIAGVVILGIPEGGAAVAGASGMGGLNFGDILALVGAACYSLYIFRISCFARLGLPGGLVQAWKTVILAGMYAIWAAADIAKYMSAGGPAGGAAAAALAPWAGWTYVAAWGIIAFSAFVPGYLADVLQAKGQEAVTPSETQVLLAGEPLFAAIFGAVLLGEILGLYGYIGGACLIGGSLLASVGDGGDTDNADEKKA